MSVRRLIAAATLATLVCMTGTTLAAPASGSGGASPRAKAGERTRETANATASAADLLAMMDEAKAFTAASKTYRDTINGIVKRAYTQRKTDLIDRYEKKIREQEVEERDLRYSAITLFEDFLRRYPNDKRWTPDVIFRLAELYFEKAKDEYLLSDEKYNKAIASYEKEMDAFKAGKRAAKPPVPEPPKVDYARTISLHRRLIREFPKYRLLDGAYYLLGFCLMEMAQEDQGNQAFLALVCSNRYRAPINPAEPTAADGVAGEGDEPAATAASRIPDTATGSMADPNNPLKPMLKIQTYDNCQPLKPKGKFNPEAWIRIGEYHFDVNQFGQAIAAYQRVLNLGPKDNSYYDEALYKLAWTYYRADRFTEAIAHFDKLVVFSDSEEKRTGKPSALRPESVQYLGISFAEEDWDGDTLPDEESGMQRVEQFYGARIKEKHVYEVYKRLGDIYYDTTKYDAAVKVYQKMLTLWPYRADNPDMQEKIVSALDRQRKFDEAMTAREDFTKLFGKGTEWESRNKDNTKALKKAQQFDEQALIQAAIYHHKRGQDSKSKGIAMNDGTLLQEASREYALAAKAYEKYLERFPNTKNSYEIKYSYALCLYYSQKFTAAAKVFAEVRDSNLDNRFQEEAAFSATKAYEEYINNLVRVGQLPDPPLPKASAPPASLSPMPYPEPYDNWRKALDAYTTVLPKSPKTPRLTYKAAELTYRFLHFDEARKRFENIYEKYCKDAMGKNAGDAILVTFQLENNRPKMLEWAKKLQKSQCGGASATADGKGTTKLGELIEGLEFKEAEDLMAAKKYKEASEKYLEFVDKYPDSKDADKALNNAAVAVEKDMSFESASKLYERLWQKYPNSPHAANALWRTAINYQKFFEFDKAVSNFLNLAKSPRFANPKTDDERKNRIDAMWNAAQILENNQDYAKAAKWFLKYAEEKGTSKEAADAYFRVGLIYKKMGDINSMIRIFREFPKRYGSVAKQERRIVEGIYRIAEFYDKERKDWRNASRYYQQTIDQWKRYGAKPAGDAAEFAADAAFQLIEKKLDSYLKLTIKGSLKAIPAKSKAMAAKAGTLKKEYEGIWMYKRARWTLAAMYRSGTIFEHFAKTMDGAYRNAPIPKQVSRLGQEAIDIYMTQVDQVLVQEVDPLVTQAKSLYSSCIQKAREMGVSNKYTEEALVRLNAFDPVTYPLLKRAKVEYSLE